MRTSKPMPPPSVFESESDTRRRSLSAAERKRIADSLLAAQLDLTEEKHSKKTAVTRHHHKPSHAKTRAVLIATLAAVLISGTLLFYLKAMTLEKLLDHMLAAVFDAGFLLALGGE